MVKEALFERSNLLAIAPHLSNALPIMLPIYRLDAVLCRNVPWIAIRSVNNILNTEADPAVWV